MVTLTEAVLVATAFGLAAYDVFAFGVGGTRATISYTVWTTSKAYPVVPFSLGFICGHLFWQLSLNGAGQDH